MPFALLFVGALLVAAGLNGKTSTLFTLVKGDIESNGTQAGYIYWMVSILVIGSLGYVEELKGLSRVFMGLVLVVLFLKEGNPQGVGGGFFAQFEKALNVNPQTTSPTLNVPTSGAGNDTSLGNILGSTNFTETFPTSGAGNDTTLGNILGAY